jgi:hypothetical protein
MADQIPAEAVGAIAEAVAPAGDGSAWAKLKSNKLVMVALVVAALAGAWWWWSKKKRASTREPMAEPMLAQQEGPVAASKKQRSVTFAQPIDDAPLALGDPTAASGGKSGAKTVGGTPARKAAA